CTAITCNHRFGMNRQRNLPLLVVQMFTITAVMHLLCDLSVQAGEPSGTVTVPIELTLVDETAIAYATFQSHNHKVVGNRHGLFITYVHSSNADYTAQKWRLARSLDGGRSFATIIEETHATSAPVLETDRQGALFLARPDFKDGNAYLSRLAAPSDRPTV